MNSNDRQEVLMKKYIFNQKTCSVNIAFKDMYDSQSRYRVAAKKREFPMKNTEGEGHGYHSNMSFNDNGANQNRSSISQRVLTTQEYHCETSVASSDRLSLNGMIEQYDNDLRSSGESSPIVPRE